MSDTKFCNKCKQTNSIEDFYKSASKKDGLHTFCKKCESEYNTKSGDKKKRFNPISCCPECGSSKILYRSRTKDNKCYDCKLIIPIIRAGVLYWKSPIILIGFALISCSASANQKRAIDIICEREAKSQSWKYILRKKRWGRRGYDEHRVWWKRCFCHWNKLYKHNGEGI